MSDSNKSKGKSMEQEFSKELSQNISVNTLGKSGSKSKFSPTSQGAPQSAKSYDITIPTGLEPGE